MYYHSTYIYIAVILSYARGLRRSLLDLRSGTASITLRPQLGDFVARSSTCARGLPRSLSDHGSGTSSLTPRPWLRDFVARSSTCARGLPRPLSDHGSRTLRLDHMRLATRIQLGYSFLFRPCYKAHTSPSSMLGDYIGMTHLPVHLVSPVRRLDS